MKRSVAAKTFSFLVMLLPLLAHATVTGVGAGCGTIPAGTANFTVSYTAAVPAVSGVMVVLVTSQNAPLGTVQDNRANLYPGSITRANTGLVFARIGQINTGISIGDSITFPFMSVPVGGMQACAQIYASSDMLVPVVTDQVNGNSGATTASVHAITSGTVTTTSNLQVIHAAAFTLGATGVVSTDPNFTNHVSMCSAGNTICMLTATREVSATGTFSWSTTIGTDPTTWAAVIATYKRQPPDAIFKDGFE